MCKYFQLVTLIAAISISSPIKAQGPDTTKNKYIVGIKQTPPFIIKGTDGRYSGLSVSLWEKIADELGIQYEYQEYDLKGLINALENNEIDLCINPLTVTSQRVRSFDFTQPFFITNLAIATNREHKSQLLIFVKNLFSLDFFKAVLLLFVVILIFGLLVWLFERKSNREEFGEGMHGVWSGIWWSAVTMTTVGYGDKSPKTTGGRLVALVWMFTAIIIISGFTASIASSLTVDRLESDIRGPEDLKEVKVASIDGSTSAEYLTNRKISYQNFTNPEKALLEIANGNLDAFVYDEPILKFFIQQNRLEGEIQILPNKFNTQYYSFSMPKESGFLNILNPVLLQKIKNVEWKAVLNKYGLDD